MTWRVRSGQRWRKLSGQMKLRLARIGRRRCERRRSDHCVALLLRCWANHSRPAPFRDKPTPNFNSQIFERFYSLASVTGCCLNSRIKFNTIVRHFFQENIPDRLRYNRDSGLICLPNASDAPNTQGAIQAAFLSATQMIIF